jgi:peptide/nickel transport system permease protein
MTRSTLLEVLGLDCVRTTRAQGLQEQIVLYKHALRNALIPVTAKEILANILVPILVQISLGIGLSIILETGLSFVGLGPPPPAASWGRMIEEARRFMRLIAMILIWPALAIGLCVSAFNMLGDALWDHLDLRLRRGCSQREEAN